MRMVTSRVMKRCVYLKLNRSYRPKGTESDYNGYGGVIVDGRTVPGLQMASEVFIIICDVEPGFAT